MSSKPFLFVNKDSSSNSLTRSTAKEQSSINSHVQRGRRHRRSTNPTRRRPTVKKEENLPTESSSSASATSPASSASSTSIPIRATGYNTFVLTPDGGHKYLPPEQDYHDPTRPSHDRQAAVRISTAQQTSDDLVSFATPDPSSYDSEIRRTTSLTPLDFSGSIALRHHTAGIESDRPVSKVFHSHRSTVSSTDSVLQARLSPSRMARRDHVVPGRQLCFSDVVCRRHTQRLAKRRGHVCALSVYGRETGIR